MVYRRDVGPSKSKELGSERLILNLRNVVYLPNNPSNLACLGLLNVLASTTITKNQTLYDKVFWNPLTFAQRWETSFLFHPLNLSASVTNLLKTNNNVYEITMPQIHQTQNSRLPLIT